jgi:hypothetical protein
MRQNADFPTYPAFEAAAGDRCKTNPDQDTADLADPEPDRFNRFGNPHRHNAAEPFS